MNMAFKIGFTAKHTTETAGAAVETTKETKPAPRKSVVRIRFPQRGMELSYYNDRFDLHPGDRVWVDGKLAEHPGIVTAVNYSFRINLADYKRVIARIDTDVHGSFVMGGSHFITFDRGTTERGQVRLWFAPPTEENAEFVCGSDTDTAFPLHDLRRMGVDAGTAERGHDYYRENRVLYLALDGDKGYALVEGREIYEVEFTYRNGEVSDLICSCFCGGKCKHAFAAMLQLEETLALIEKQYAAAFAESNYFAAICKGTLFSYAIDGKESGSFTL